VYARTSHNRIVNMPVRFADRTPPAPTELATVFNPTGCFLGGWQRRIQPGTLCDI